MTNSSKLKCPHCGNTTNILTEKRPYGDSQCTSCKYKAKTSDFANFKNYIEQKIQTQENTMYLTASGNIIKITNYDKEDCIFNSSVNIEYNSYGHDIRDNSSNDLIAEIPKDLHLELIRVIDAYYNNKLLNYYIKKAYKKGELNE